MMRKILSAALLPLLLAGCPGHPVATFTIADTGNAGAMAGRAAAGGDNGAAIRSTCYSAWNNVAQGVQGVTPGSAGVFTGVEAGIEVQNTLQHPGCQSIAGQVILWVLQKAPIGVPGV